MRTCFAVLALATYCLLPPMVRAAETPTDDRGEVEALKRLGQQMGDAMIARDVATLDRIFADDWQSLGATGKLVTKTSVLEAFESGADTLESFTLGPMDVLVLGKVAAVRGTVTEVRRRDGKDVSGELLYMDLLEKRGGSWVVIRSTGRRLR